MSNKTVALLGNPNCGKSTLFNRLTGAKQHIGNWPGVTVERVEGVCSLTEQECTLIDLPGTYALSDSSSEFSIDEQIAHQAVSSNTADLYINIVDAANLERHLFLTSQLLANQVNTVVVLNMIDAARKRGLVIDTKALSQQLGCPVVAISASTGEGIDQLLQIISQELTHPSSPPEVHETAADIQSHYKKVDQWLQQCVSQASDEDKLSEKIDRVVLNKYLGFPIFLFVIYGMFLFSINVGSVFIDVFDGIAGLLFVDTVHYGLAMLGLPEWLRVFIADGIGGGMQLVASFIPVIGAMFLILAWLEDWGYMARAAFVMDKIMRKIGLPGKAFVPLIVGFGCNVPAVMAARTLDNERDRISAILMAPFMSCGARLTVYALFAAAFFPVGGHNIVFSLYLIGILIAVLSAFAMKKTLLKGDSSHFVMELPSYHLPLLRNILTRTWHRLQGFVVRAGKAIVLVVMVLNVVNSLGTDGSFGNQNTEKSALSQVGKAITPIFSPMGISQDNWPATVGIFTGIFAKEVVVGTLDSLYSSAEAQSSEYDFMGSFIASLKTVPENLAGLADQVLDPLGLSVLASSDLEAAAELQAVSTSTFGAMQRAFDGKIGAYTYLLFVLLYMPCAATVGAMFRELNSGWSLFISAWSFGIGYGVSVGFYQAATFARHPMSSSLWLVAIGLSAVVTIIALRLKASRQEAYEARTIIARSSG